MRRFLSSTALVSVAVLALTGCRTFWDPTFMPSGYAHLNKEYKAAPGPEARDLGYEYSADTNDQIVQLWHVTVADLLTKLEEQTGTTAQPVYLEPPLDKNAFNSTYDEALRSGLRDRGYTLVSIPGSTLHLRYEATPTIGQGIKTKADDHPYFRHYDLTLTILDPASEDPQGKWHSAVVGQVQNSYELPTYGDKTGQPLPPLLEQVNQ